MTIGRRFLLTIVIVLVILFALALVGWISGRWDEAPAAGAQGDLYQGIPLDEKLLHLDKQALEAAYLQHLIKLWNVWLSDGAREAHRISTGLRIARDSYRQASQQIAKREQELQQQDKKQ